MLRGLVCLSCLLTATSGTPVPGPGGPVVAAARAEARRSVLPRPLPFFYDLYTFRGDGGSTEVVAALAVPVDQLGRERAHRDVRYRFDVTLILADTAMHSVYRTADSMFFSVRHPLAGTRLLYTQVQVQAPPSVSTVQRVIMTDATAPGIGQLYSTPFRIPDYSGTHLMLSDVALGLPGAEGGWKRGNVHLALLPTSQFPRSSFDLYYEIYNLPSGKRYSTEIAIQPLGPPGSRDLRDERTVRTRFVGESTAGADGVVRELRRVDASLSEGRYRLTVTVTNEDTGETAARSRDFEVRGGSSGETLVPARPYRNHTDG
jgi:hypothetical protein